MPTLSTAGEVQYSTAQLLGTPNAGSSSRTPLANGSEIELTDPRTSDSSIYLKTLTEDVNGPREGILKMNVKVAGIVKRWVSVFVQLQANEFIIYNNAKRESVKFNIPLKFAYVTKLIPENETVIEKSRTVFAIRGRLSKTSKPIVLQETIAGSDSPVSFYSLIKRNISVLDARACDDLLDTCSDDHEHQAISKMGWALEKSSILNWKPRFLVISECHLMILESTPNISSDFDGARKYQVQTLLVRKLEPTEAMYPFHTNVLAVTTPTGPIFLSFDSKSDVNGWLRAISNASIRKFRFAKEYAFRATIQSVPWRFTINAEHGLILENLSSQSSNGESPNADKQIRIPISLMKSLSHAKSKLYLQYSLQAAAATNSAPSSPLTSTSPQNNNMLSPAAVSEKGLSRSKSSINRREQVLEFPDETIPVSIVATVQNMTKFMLSRSEKYNTSYQSASP